MEHLKNTHYIRWLALLAVVLIWGSACTHIKPVATSEGSTSYTLDCPWKQMVPEDIPGPSYNVIGKATWYGKQFHRRKTTSGERFNMYGYTAAHRTLPFGTRVLVTNLANGKSVVVKVNDRGPRSRRLVIDLSYAAAKKIGMKGTCEVEVERLSGPTVSRKNSSSESYDDSEVYALQAGSFETRELAECLMVKLGKEYDSVKLISEKGLFKVRVGAFEDPHQARVMKEEFINKGYQVFTVKQTPEALVLADSKTIQSCSAQ